LERKRTRGKKKKMEEKEGGDATIREGKGRVKERKKGSRKKGGKSSKKIKQKGGRIGEQ